MLIYLFECLTTADLFHFHISFVNIYCGWICAFYFVSHLCCSLLIFTGVIKNFLGFVLDHHSCHTTYAVLICANLMITLPELFHVVWYVINISLLPLTRRLLRISLSVDHYSKIYNRITLRVTSGRCLPMISGHRHTQHTYTLKQFQSYFCGRHWHECRNVKVKQSHLRILLKKILIHSQIHGLNASKICQVKKDVQICLKTRVFRTPES